MPTAPLTHGKIEQLVKFSKIPNPPDWKSKVIKIKNEPRVKTDEDLNQSALRDTILSLEEEAAKEGRKTMQNVLEKDVLKPCPEHQTLHDYLEQAINYGIQMTQYFPRVYTPNVMYEHLFLQGLCVGNLQSGVDLQEVQKQLAQLHQKEDDDQGNSIQDKLEERAKLITSFTQSVTQRRNLDAVDCAELKLAHAELKITQLKKIHETLTCTDILTNRIECFKVMLDQSKGELNNYKKLEFTNLSTTGQTTPPAQWSPRQMHFPNIPTLQQQQLLDNLNANIQVNDQGLSSDGRRVFEFNDLRLKGYIPTIFQETKDQDLSQTQKLDQDQTPMNMYQTPMNMQKKQLKRTLKDPNIELAYKLQQQDKEQIRLNELNLIKAQELQKMLNNEEIQQDLKIKYDRQRNVIKGKVYLQRVTDQKKIKFSEPISPDKQAVYLNEIERSDHHVKRPKCSRGSQNKMFRPTNLMKRL